MKLGGPTRTITTPCYAGTPCSSPATHLILWTTPTARYATSGCEPHRDSRLELVRHHATQTIPIAKGTFTLVADSTGTQVGLCRHCGHHIYLYPALAGQPDAWRGGEYDPWGEPGEDTRRCPSSDDPHEPALTTDERDLALTRTACGRLVPHSVADCRPKPQPAVTLHPVRQLAAVVKGLSRQGLGAHAKLVLTAVILHADEAGLFFPDDVDLLALCDLEPRELREAVDVLAGHGLLTADRQGDVEVYTLARVTLDR